MLSLLKLKAASSSSHDMDVTMSEEYIVENHSDNTNQCEKLSGDNVTEDNIPFTNNVSKPSSNLLDVAVERKEDYQISKVVKAKRKFDEADAGVFVGVGNGEKMTSFPSMNDDIQATNIAATEVKDNENASHGPLSEAAVNMSVSLSPVDDLSLTKQQTGQSEFLHYSFLYLVKLRKDNFQQFACINVYYFIYFEMHFV